MWHWDTGRVVAYVGGTGVSVSSVAEKARTAGSSADMVDTVTLLQVPIQLPNIEITVADITTVGGFLIVAARFGWDVWKDIRNKREKERAED